MKRALLVGIDSYTSFNNLGGCANDAEALEPLLARNEDNSPNFDCRTLTARDARKPISRDALLEQIHELLGPGGTFALFYFAGHGAPVNGDVSLVASNGTTTTPGVLFSEILTVINSSPVNEVVVILDCCFSGGATTIGALGNQLANLRPGLSVLTASRNDQVSMETIHGRGQFSTYLEGALDAGAADVLGHVNVSGLYAYLSESFGPWEQRPTFKANIDRLQDIRKCDPRVPLETLRKLTEWFPATDYDFALDPSFEPTAEPNHPENEHVFSGLQKFRSCRLIEPIDEEHLYFAAMHSKGCRLTALGKHYWRQVTAGRI
ncbi:caspase family protein [Arthrobacter sp. MSA 4-2]|uniref:caspase family protein n=1 Tax=Arthrobacter sp. MSA 4-2 TaxID=2794349 RepID=UPI0018E810B6|nr:caspase family protein [Arthrobacter sp. MSA 4-2]MBJ2120857.1 caspase family protein [Arthrobacter sp. MSA 4-2]